MVVKHTVFRQIVRKNSQPTNTFPRKAFLILLLYVLYILGIYSTQGIHKSKHVAGGIGDAYFGGFDGSIPLCIPQGDDGQRVHELLGDRFRSPIVIVAVYTVRVEQSR